MSETNAEATTSSDLEVGLDLTFAEVSVLPLARGSESDPVGVRALGLSPTAEGSVEARSGLASLAVRRLLDVTDQGVVVAPALEQIASALVEPDHCIEVVIDGNDTDAILILGVGEIVLIHRRISGVAHRFTPVEPGSTTLTTFERLATSVLASGESRVTARTVVEGGRAVDRPWVELTSDVRRADGDLADRIRTVAEAGL